MPSVRQRAETNKRDRTNREENYVIQEQDRKPNWKNKQTRKISKELNKENMWLPYPAFETSLDTHLPDLWTWLRSIRHLLFEILSFCMGVCCGSLAVGIQPQKHFITEEVQSQTTLMQMKEAKWCEGHILAIKENELLISEHFSDSKMTVCPLNVHGTNTNYAETNAVEPTQHVKTLQVAPCRFINCVCAWEAGIGLGLD